MPDLALPRSNEPPLTQSPNSVLRLVFDYLSPIPGRGCSSKELLAHLRSLQRVAAVNQEWRAVALPLFYNTAYVVIGRPLDPLDADDSDDDGMIIGTKWQGVEKDDSMSIANEGQDKADAVNRGDNWDSDNDEEVLKEIGLSRRGVDIGLSTNIGLIRAMGQIGNAREVQIIVQGEGQTAGQFLRQLLLAKFGRYVWLAVKRLRIDMRDSSSRTQTNTMAERRPNALKDFNELLSALLPSLREIKFYGPHSKAIYGCLFIERLIKERLHRPESLHAVRVKADCWPKLTDDYDTGESALPVFIECMEIDGPDETYLMPVPMMVADTLVELKLAPMIEHYGWSLFESLGDLDPTEPVIRFSSLRKLTLSLVNIERELEYRMEKDDCSDQESSSHCVEVDETDYWEPCSVCMRRKENEDDGELYCGDVLDQFSTRFGHLLKECKPSFPALTSLELCEPPFRRLLGVFSASPITSLVLSRLCFEEPRDGDLSTFRFLRSLSIPILLTMNKDKITYFIEVLSTVCSGLQHLSLVINLSKDLSLRFSHFPFAASLISLTLEGEYGQHDVEHLLQLFPNIQILSVCAIFSEPIFSVSKLTDEYHRAHTAQILPPLNTLLRVLEVYEKRYFLDYYVWSSTPMSKRLMASELNHYRGILIGLVYRLPALDTLRVGAQSVDDVNESIGAIVDTNVGQEYIDRLKRLRVRPLEY